ncbi:MAG: sugar ABC transporter ATP-binding protein [Planctomycetota bacterium]
MSDSTGQQGQALCLVMRDVHKRFGATVALDGVNLAVAAGEVRALVGENGAGKSTLMKVLSGALAPDAGTMTLDGESYRPRGPAQARRAGVAMIYQELSLAPHMTVEENISLGVEPTRLGWLRRGQIRQRAREVIRFFHHPEIRPDVPVRQLSVGAQQLVEIGRALAVGCKVLVLDEPTSSLSQEDIGRLFELIRRLRDEGVAVVYISHFLEEVQQIADRVTVLRDGAVVGGGRTGDLSLDRIIAMMVGRQVEQLYPRSPRRPGEAVLRVRKLRGREKPFRASFDLYRGEVMGIAGLVGAGRTELLRAVFGLDPIRRGEVKVAAWSGPASPARRWAQGVGLLSEDRKGEGLAMQRSVADNVTLPGLGWLVRPGWQRTVTWRWVERLGIRCRGPSQDVLHLSGGNQQKVAVARLLEQDVDVLLLDEPTRGIDVGSKALIYQLIDQLASPTEGGRSRAVLIVSSYLPELMGICDRVAVMYRGLLGPAREVRNVTEEQLMAEATGQGGAR